MARHERGAAPVATLEALPGLEAWTVCALRLWSDGQAGRAALVEDSARRMGDAAGERIAGLFGELAEMVLGHARRPLLRHSNACSCVGAEEAVFAHFLAAATQGEREDALMIACLIMRTDVAPLAVSLAQTVGLALLRAAAPEPSAAARPARAPERLH